MDELKELGTSHPEGTPILLNEVDVVDVIEGPGESYRRGTLRPCIDALSHRVLPTKGAIFAYDLVSPKCSPLYHQNVQLSCFVLNVKPGPSLIPVDKVGSPPRYSN